MQDETNGESRAPSAALSVGAASIDPPGQKRFISRLLWLEVKASWPLGALCLLSGSRWLLDEALPEARSTPTSAGWGCLAAALAVAIWSMARRQRWPRVSTGEEPAKWTMWVAGVSVLTGPALSGSVAGRHISGNTATLALALAPAVAAVAVTAGGVANEIAGLLWPGLAGTAGLLLLLPQPDLGNWRMDVAIAAMPLLVGVGAARAGQSSSGSERVPGCVPRFMHLSASWLAITLSLSAVLFFAIGVWTSQGQGLPAFSAAASAADGLSSLLSLLVLTRVGTMRWSAQFLLVPLLAIVEGIAFLHPTVSVRSWTGIGLLALGSAVLAFGRGQRQTPTICRLTVP